MINIVNSIKLDSESIVGKLVKQKSKSKNFIKMQNAKRKKKKEKRNKQYIKNIKYYE